MNTEELQIKTKKFKEEVKKLKLQFVRDLSFDDLDKQKLLVNDRRHERSYYI